MAELAFELQTMQRSSPRSYPPHTILHFLKGKIFSSSFLESPAQAISPAVLSTGLDRLIAQ